MTAPTTDTDVLRRVHELADAIADAHADEDAKARAAVAELLAVGNTECATELARKSQAAGDRARALRAELAELRTQL